MSVRRLALFILLLTSHIGCGDLPTQDPTTKTQAISYGRNAGQSDAAKPVVRLVFDNGNPCTGTIIADKWIVTSAHCLPLCWDRFPCPTQFNQFITVHINLLTYESYIDENNDPQYYLAPQQVYRGLASFFPSQQYTHALDHSDDIALIRLNGPLSPPADQNDYRMRMMDEWTWVGAQFDTYGWGKMEDGTFPNQLQRNKYPRRVAAKYYRSFKSYANPSGNCGGDSGGPAVRDASSEPPVLFGVLSLRGNNAGGDIGECPNRTGSNIFTQVKPHLPWIKSLIAVFGRSCTTGKLTNYWDLDYVQCF